MTAKRNPNEIVWNSIRASIPCATRFPTELNVKGCIPCDHTEMNNVLDDGIRLDVKLYDKSHSFAPEGGHKVNDYVLYNGEEKIVSQVYFDKAVDLQDVDQGRISPLLLGWPGMERKICVGDIIDWNIGQDDMPVKVINWKYHNDGSITLDLKIMNLGMPIHEIASMIPHMGPNAVDRPGWVFDTDKNGKTIYPHIRNVANRLDYITRFINELNHGTVNIWEVPGYRIEMSPFGGIKDSGLGYKEGVIEAMKSFTNLKTFSMPWM